MHKIALKKPIHLHAPVTELEIPQVVIVFSFDREVDPRNGMSAAEFQKKIADGESLQPRKERVPARLVAHISGSGAVGASALEENLTPEEERVILAVLERGAARFVAR